MQILHYFWIDWFFPESLLPWDFPHGAISHGSSILYLDGLLVRQSSSKVCQNGKICRFVFNSKQRRPRALWQ
jgi:hypothetical protein